jgi:hypothetical protein
MTGASIEIFFADRTLESFGRNGADWFWWQRQRGFAPNGPAVGPFPTCYSAYRNALAIQNESNLKVNADILRTRRDDLEADRN